ICGNHGQMIKASTGALCSNVSPAACAACLPERSAAAFMRRELFVKAAFARANAFVSPSRFLLQRYVDWGLPAAKTCLLENGLDAGPASPPRPLPQRSGRRNRFAYFGQLNPFKGIRVLLQAVARVPADVWVSDSVLDVFGGNLELQPERFQQEFRTLVTAAGRRVRYFGSYRNDELSKLMAGIDWVIVPSTWWENAPVVIQEAFAHGRPVICSDIGGMAEKVRDNVDGLHFRAGSVDSLTERLVGVLRAPQLWGRLRERIRPPLSGDGAAAQHIGLYRRLTGDDRRLVAGGTTSPERQAVAAE
ncbi:MAG TPA: glycosyltransferase, partial [Rhodospirillales bacterium]|nr:glycosyltransferase [Rhodospirillales bacterium]